MIFKLLPFVVLLGVGLRFLANIAAVNARRKWMKAQQAGGVDQMQANRELFWRRVDRACIVIAVVAAIWYIVGIFMWLFPA